MAPDISPCPPAAKRSRGGGHGTRGRMFCGTFFGAGQAQTQEQEAARRGAESVRGRGGARDFVEAWPPVPARGPGEASSPVSMAPCDELPGAGGPEPGEDSLRERAERLKRMCEEFLQADKQARISHPFTPIRPLRKRSSVTLSPSKPVPCLLCFRRGVNCHWHSR